MTRTAWRYLVLMPCLLAGTWLSAAENEAVAKRPNILFAFADDWGRQAGVYAQIDGPGTISDAAKTPNIDALAARGVTFRSAFVNAPSCTPCRSSLVSGQYFWRTGRGAILLGAVWDESIPSYPLLLHDNGYHIGKTAKVWSPGTPGDAPYGGQKFAYQKAGMRFNQFSQTATKLVAGGQSVEDAKQAILDEVRGNVRDMLAAKPDDEPFCYWFGPTNVHRKWIQGSGKKLWGIDPDSLAGKMPPFLPDVPTVREDLADYLGEAAAFDAELGVLLDELKKAGELENTIVVVSGDHGPAGFPHGKCNLYDFGTGVGLIIAGPGINGGRVVDDLVCLTDLAPTFLEAGDTKIPDVVTGRSLWPILKSNKSGQVREDWTWVVTGRERHVASAREGDLPYPQRCIRTPDYSLIINFRPDRYPLGDPYRLDTDKEPTEAEITNNTFVTLPDEDAGPTKAWIVTHRNEPEVRPFFDHAYGKRPREELFDLKKDPHQMNNVVGDPAYADVLNRLRDQLMAELERTGDPRLVDDGKFFETPPMAGPVERDAPRRPARQNQ